ncbi:hypothetical protein [Peribacillus frigoritolerans]|uniref:hypothetical protein n=1 Tax=Peribacillus frigoritolerans TaxID=450367 RepID=UPI001404665D|nr:hypothetical protein [Peribacillus frigoritolerans]
MSFIQRDGCAFDINTMCDSCEEPKLCAPFDDKNQKENTINLCEGCVFGMTILGFAPLE